MGAISQFNFAVQKFAANKPPLVPLPGPAP